MNLPSPTPETPRFGYTEHGVPVHLRVIDHLPDKHAADRFNSWLAVRITSTVGTMWCAYAFAAIALAGLPQAISLSFQGGHFSPLPLVQWLAQTFLQLVLLSVIIVGQNIQSKASDARAIHTLEHTEVILDRLDVKTQDGIAVLDKKIDALAEALNRTGS